MDFVPLEQVKAHLRVIGEDEDDVLTLYRNAAERAAECYLGRHVYGTEQALLVAIEAGIAGDAPMVADDDVRAAVLLTVGYLYRHREETMTPVAQPLSPGARWLLLPHRVHMGV